MNIYYPNLKSIEAINIYNNLSNITLNNTLIYEFQIIYGNLIMIENNSDYLYINSNIFKLLQKSKKKIKLYQLLITVLNDNECVNYLSLMLLNILYTILLKAEYKDENSTYLLTRQNIIKQFEVVYNQYFSAIKVYLKYDIDIEKEDKKALTKIIIYTLNAFNEKGVIKYDILYKKQKTIKIIEVIKINYQLNFLQIFNIMLKEPTLKSFIKTSVLGSDHFLNNYPIYKKNI